MEDIHIVGPIPHFDFVAGLTLGELVLTAIGYGVALVVVIYVLMLPLLASPRFRQHVRKTAEQARAAEDVRPPS